MKKLLNGKKQLSIEHRLALSEAKSGTNNPISGIKRSEETRSKISIKMSGCKHHFWGKRHALSSIKKMIASRTGKKFTEEHKKNISNGMKKAWSKRLEKSKAYDHYD